MRGTLAVIAALAVVCLGAAARGEIRGADSIELEVAESEVVAAVEVRAIEEDAIVIECREAIKGEPPQRIPYDSRLRDDLKGAAKQNEPLVLLLRDGRLSDRAQVKFPRSKRPGVVTMQFDAPLGEEWVLAAVRNAAAAGAPRPRKAISIEPPWDSQASRGLYSGSAVFVRVPVDERLEKLGHSWLAEGFADLAVQALREFPSPRNVEIFRSLLNDTTRTTSGVGRLTREEYSIRSMAWHGLRNWGEDVSRPIIVNPDDHYRAAGWPLIAAAMVVLLPAGIVGWRGGTRRVRRALTAFMATCTLVGAGIWWHSRGPLNEVFWDGASRQVWLSSCGGWLQFTLISNWGGNWWEDRYVPFGESMEAFHAGDHERGWAREHPPRGLLIGALPDLPVLWRNAPLNVRRDWNSTVASMLLGQYDSNRIGHPVKMPFYRFQVRWWLVIALLGAYPAWRYTRDAFAFARMARRRRAGRCVHCAYDLRGLMSDRCPECGAAIPAQLDVSRTLQCR